METLFDVDQYASEQPITTDRGYFELVDDQSIKLSDETLSLFVIHNFVDTEGFGYLKRNIGGYEVNETREGFSEADIPHVRETPKSMKQIILAQLIRPDNLIRVGIGEELSVEDFTEVINDKLLPDDEDWVQAVNTYIRCAINVAEQDTEDPFVAGYYVSSAKLYAIFPEFIDEEAESYREYWRGSEQLKQALFDGLYRSFYRDYEDDAKLLINEFRVSEDEYHLAAWDTYLGNKFGRHAEDYANEKFTYEHISSKYRKFLPNLKILKRIIVDEIKIRGNDYLSNSEITNSDDLLAAFRLEQKKLLELLADINTGLRSQ